MPPLAVGHIREKAMGKIKHVHTVATAHLDTVWNWDFETTVRHYIPRTLKWNFAFFEKYPDYVFNFEGAYRYELMEEYYPEMFEKLKEYVAAGKWYPCGSAWENGDVNVPSPEALFRNFLYGNEYFDKKFSIRSKDVFLPDCFGFGYALPSIARHSNLWGFTTQKLTWGSAYGQPFDIGKWYGPDGKYIIASVKMHNYFAVLTKLRKNGAIKEKLHENEKYGLDATEIFHGVGDRGGGPLPISVAILNSDMKENDKSDIKVHSSPADRVFKEIMTEMTEEQRDALPSWNDELLLTNHGTGGYTSRAISKRWNRRGEELADMAERAACTAKWLGSADYPLSQLNTAWKRLISHQFHDDLPGTSIQRAYLRSWNDYGLSLNQFAHEFEQSAAAVVSMMDTSFCKGTAIVVNNPIEAHRKGCVSAIIDGTYEHINVVDAHGKSVAAQVLDSMDGKTAVAFIADVEPMGFAVYDLRKADAPCKVSTDLRVEENLLENARYTVKLDDNGDIASIFDKQLGKELLKEPISLCLFDYKGSWIYPAWELDFDQCIREAQHSATLVGVKIVENGPARVALRVVQEAKGSVFVNTVSLSQGSDIVEVHCEFEWESMRTLLKNKFSFTAENAQATFDLGLGAIKRGNARRNVYEVPAQKWAEITDKSGDFGVAVLSDCKYGWDKYNNHTLRLTVVHTPQNNSRTTSMQSMMDLGLNRYGYGICAHEGGDLTRVQLAAREFSAPMTAFCANKHKGSLSKSFSFGSISDNGVIIRAVKKAENTDEIVVRVNEGVNRQHNNVRLTLGNGIKSAREIYASEEEIGSATVENGELVFSMSPYEVRSFALTLAVSRKKAAREAQLPVELPYNTKAQSSNNARAAGCLPGKDYAIPAELLPQTLTSGGVDFNIGKGSVDALTAHGQKIALDKNYGKLEVVAASLNADTLSLYHFGKRFSTSAVKLFSSEIKKA